MNLAIRNGQLTQELKMRGGFNTPDLLARFLVSWAIRNPSDKAIDPSSGDAIFLQEAIERLQFLGADSSAIQQVIGVEIDSPTARSSRNRLIKRFGEAPQIINKGFFEFLPTLEPESLDSYFGNPPFLRYKNFPKGERELALKFMEKQGFGSSKLTNAWVPFLVAGIYLLKPKGRLAMVMPAELLQVSYASNIREYLLNKFGFIFVVSFNRLVFPDVQQETVLLMGTKGEGNGMRLVEVKDANELEGIPRREMPQIPIQNSKEKWTQYFLNDSQRSVMKKSLDHPSLKRLGDVCSVDVGIVTGLNEYFVLNYDEATKLNADQHLVPIVTRTKNLQGVIFTKSDWNENCTNHQPSYLLSIQPVQGISKGLESYIEKGEAKRVNKGYKLSIRDPWYVIPSVWIPDAFLFRQIGSFPRMVLNGASATCTDTLHRVKFNSKKSAKSITAIFHNSLTLAFGEIFGRSYGGGVLELMPTEAEKLPIPMSEIDSNKMIGEIDSLMREGLHEQALNFVDNEVLIEELSFKKSDIATMRSAWIDLSNRRKSRKKLEPRIG
jgi:adenine-specific DNA-methyltransferase